MKALISPLTKLVEYNEIRNALGEKRGWCRYQAALTPRKRTLSTGQVWIFL